MIVVPSESDLVVRQRQSIPVKQKIAVFILVVFVGFVFVIGFGFYFGHWHHGFARTVARILPLPAASVEGDIIWYHDVVELAAAFELGKENKVFDSFDEALDVAIDRKLLTHLAEDIGVEVSKDEVADYALDDPSLQGFLDELRWNEADYRKYVVAPLLLSQGAEEAVYGADAYQNEAYDRAKKLLDDIERGIDFGDLAKQYSDDISSDFEGDIGYFGEDNIDAGFLPALELEFDEVSGILDIGTYYAIAKAYDVIGEGEDLLVGLQIITVNKAGLDKVLEEFTKDRDVRFFVR
ncbi:MAG: peptidylprolyl isomerase [Candidatus Uhrbacteria bacterium]|nr:peptidylprolyl isomerase [Candidatus Uhrbacteria bacterium]